MRLAGYPVHNRLEGRSGWKRTGSGGGNPYRDTSVADTDISPVSVVHRPANSAPFSIRADMHVCMRACASLSLSLSLCIHTTSFRTVMNYDTSARKSRRCRTIY